MRVGLPWLRGVALWIGAASVAHAVDLPPQDQFNFFESRIRPVLAEHCYGCHSQRAKKLKGDLLLDSAEGIRRGGEDGPILVPGDLKRSPLIKAIRYEDPVHAMPPKAKGGKLPDQVIADFEQWVSMGAPDPRGGTLPPAPETLGKLWSLEPPLRTEPPHPSDRAWPRTDIDRFLLTAMEASGLRPVDDADRPTLIRRAAFDLIGLPPTPEEIDAFVQDKSPAAFEHLVDRYLVSPRFGERWGRHWLDVARYAESSGRNVNFLYAQAWRYRDYVINAFNQDKPYDQFLKEQLAGDLLPFKDARDQAEKIIATGFLAIGPKAHDEPDNEKFLADVADEQIDTVSQAMLGLTIGCARCHDHKQDPITQRDYYALAGIFLSTETLYGTCYELQNWHATTLVEFGPEIGLFSALAKITPQDVLKLQAKIQSTHRAEIEASFHRETDRYQARRTREEAAFARAQLQLYQPDGTPRTLAMGVFDREKPSDSHLLIRGETSQPGELVPRGLVRILSEGEPPPIQRGSGRLDLANFIASDRNPLAARVMVNRIWSKLFGKGIVATPDNFGEMGARPTHPELLDYLALDFVENGWSVKRLIRQIMLSHAYQLSSRFNAADHQRDPDNSFLWRMSKKRLDAEAIRDSMLAVGGVLDLDPPPGSLVARQEFWHDGPSVAARQMRARPTFSRSVYLPIIRGRLPELLQTFDFADPSTVTGQREATIVPSQDLHLLSNDWVQQYADAFAGRISKTSGSVTEKTSLAFRTALGREPNAAEREAIDAFIQKFSGQDRSTTNAGANPDARLSAFCHSLFLSAEFRYLN